MSVFRSLFIIFCLCTAFIPAHCGRRKRRSALVTATCTLGEHGTAGGQIYFAQKKAGGPTFIGRFVTNVTEGKHGWHIHELGIDRKAEDPCGSAGGHFNPTDMNHGAPTARERHFGDLGNFKANAYGVGNPSIVDNLVSLVGRKSKSVLGRTIVIHAGEDDLGLGGDDESLRTGNAGARVGCCVITKA